MPQQRSKLSQQAKTSRERENAEYGPRVLVDVKSFEATMGNEPIFTRALIEQAAKQVEQIRSRHSQTEKQLLKIPHLLGGGADIVHIPSCPSPAVTLSWRHTFSLADKGGKSAPYHIRQKDTGTNLIMTETLKPDDPNHPVRKHVAHMQDPPEMEDMERFEAILLASPFWVRVKQCVDTLQVEVKNIVCMAMGSLFEDTDTHKAVKGKMSARRCTQHLLACMISAYLSQRYRTTTSSSSTLSSPSPTPIPIVAYDPIYDLKDIHILSHLSSPITVVSDPYHYLSITPSSLIIAIGVPIFVPIHEIAADLCWPSGPTGMLCNEIYEHSWHEEGKMVCLDQRTPRVGRMLGLYDAEWLGCEAVDAEGCAGRKDEVWEWAQDMFWYASKK
ncbi:Nn.00g014370.m01.CDS01 [Neocucurbitaria sp. VM-36]